MLDYVVPERIGLRCFYRIFHGTSFAEMGLFKSMQPPRTFKVAVRSFSADPWAKIELPGPGSGIFTVRRSESTVEFQDGSGD